MQDSKERISLLDLGNYTAFIDSNNLDTVVINVDTDDKANEYIEHTKNELTNLGFPREYFKYKISKPNDMTYYIER